MFLAPLTGRQRSFSNAESSVIRRLSPTSHLGAIQTKDARFFCYGNSAADISKPHTFKWDQLTDEVLNTA